jgi:hypothetical protein
MKLRNRSVAVAMAVALIVPLGLAPAVQAAEDFGMVMDVQGRVTVEHQGQRTAVSLGQTLFVGDRLSLEPKASLGVVSYNSCDELVLSGPAQAQVEGAGVSVAGGPAAKVARRLPVCYSQEELSATESGVIGGLVLRGAPKDPVFELRQEFAAGKASTSSLMTLIMHDVSSGQADQARPYFQALRQRAPDSQFVGEMRSYFPD